MSERFEELRSDDTELSEDFPVRLQWSSMVRRGYRLRRGEFLELVERTRKRTNRQTVTSIELLIQAQKDSWVNSVGEVVEASVLVKTPAVKSNAGKPYTTLDEVTVGNLFAPQKLMIVSHLYEPEDVQLFDIPSDCSLNEVYQLASLARDQRRKEILDRRPELVGRIVWVFNNADNAPDICMDILVGEDVLAEIRVQSVLSLLPVLA